MRGTCYSASAVAKAMAEQVRPEEGQLPTVIFTTRFAGGTAEWLRGKCDTVCFRCSLSCAVVAVDVVVLKLFDHIHFRSLNITDQICPGETGLVQDVLTGNGRNDELCDR